MHRAVNLQFKRYNRSYDRYEAQILIKLRKYKQLGLL